MKRKEVTQKITISDPDEDRVYWMDLSDAAIWDEKREEWIPLEEVLKREPACSLDER